MTFHHNVGHSCGGVPRFKFADGGLSSHVFHKKFQGIIMFRNEETRVPDKYRKIGQILWFCASFRTCRPRIVVLCFPRYKVIMEVHCFSVYHINSNHLTKSGTWDSISYILVSFIHELDQIHSSL